MRAQEQEQVQAVVQAGSQQLNKLVQVQVSVYVILVS